MNGRLLPVDEHHERARERWVVQTVDRTLYTGPSFDDAADIGKAHEARTGEPVFITTIEEG